MTDNIRTRFAPSPTGFVHIGSLRTALFNFLFARHFGGKLVLRIEDTDQSRLVEGAAQNLIEVLEKVGVIFDESPTKGGEFGPYTQSERLDIYKKYVDELIGNKKAYFCFCTSERLDELRKEQIALKKPSMYDRLCRNLSEQEIASKQEEFKSAGKNPVVRFAIPLDGETIVKDLVFGEMKYQNGLLDDQILMKSDGFPTYHLAAVVDDHLMQISHVIRADEWLPSTPKHVLIYEAFSWAPPQFAHLPLILNEDKSKLSKRQGDVAVEDFLKHGYLPEALINFVAFLGWNPKTEQEIFSMDELVSQFELSKVNKSGAVFDQNKLDWINSQYIRKLSDNDLLAAAKPYLEASGVDTGKFTDQYFTAVINLEKERLKKLSDLANAESGYFFAEPQYDGAMLVWKKSDAQTTKRNLQLLQDLFRITGDDVMGDSVKLEETIKAFIAEHELDNGSVLWPLRVAMTGQQKSPGPFEVTSTLFLGWGRAGVDSRIAKAISFL